MNTICMGCGQTDNHPKHQTVLPDDSSAHWHMDCHVRIDPPCSTCTAQIANANGAKGDALRQHIVSKAGAAQ